MFDKGVVLLRMITVGKTLVLQTIKTQRSDGGWCLRAIFNDHIGTGLLQATEELLHSLFLPHFFSWPLTLSLPGCPILGSWGRGNEGLQGSDVTAMLRDSDGARLGYQDSSLSQHSPRPRDDLCYIYPAPLLSAIHTVPHKYKEYMQTHSTHTHILKPVLSCCVHSGTWSAQ